MKAAGFKEFFSLKNNSSHKILMKAVGFKEFFSLKNNSSHKNTREN
jgi:hypothetical protein